MAGHLFRYAIAIGLSVVLSASCVFIFAQGVSAQESKTANVLKVSPVRTDIEVSPGGTKVIQATVANLADAPITVRPVANDFIAGDERGTPALILEEDAFAPTHSLKRFMSPLSTVTIPARSAKTIQVVITVPPTAQAGGYFGSVRFMPSDPDEGGQVNMSPSVASLILLKVPGAMVEELRVASFSVQQGDSSGFYFRSPDNISALVRFENKGNVQIAPLGKIQVQKRDAVVFESDFNTVNPYDMILPNSTRRWDVPIKELDAFGYYTLTATLTYGSKNKTLELSHSFWIVPLWALLVAILLVVIVVGGVVALIIFGIRKLRRPASHSPRQGIQLRKHRKRRRRFGR